MTDTNWGAIAAPLLAQAGLAAPITNVEQLAGGVSSDIVRITLADGTDVCAKRALARLKVASVWEAPLERNHYEVEWLRVVGEIVPGAVPRVLGEDQQTGTALLEFLPATAYSLWKTELLAGRFNPAVPGAVARVVGQVHARTWQDADIAAHFSTDTMFEALRLSPYLRTLAERTPDLARQILMVCDETAAHKLALVHGDVSPKNILVANADSHPVLLDAECAWFGDPAFDAAFCCNHLLLKSFHVPAIRTKLLAAVEEFTSVWSAALPEPFRQSTEQRVARLLPCLMLARIDGKSPVEYLNEQARMAVRNASRPMIADAPANVAEVVARTSEFLSREAA